jgi:arylamine N-acetyltransferase
VKASFTVEQAKALKGDGATAHALFQDGFAAETLVLSGFNEADVQPKTWMELSMVDTIMDEHHASLHRSHELMKVEAEKQRAQLRGRLAAKRKKRLERLMQHNDA